MSMPLASPSNLPPPPRRPRRKSLFLLGVVFLSGTICGAGLAAVIIHRAVQQAVLHPEIRAERASRWITRRLHLDASQQERVRAILKQHTETIGKLRQEIWPRVLERFETTEREISDVLSPSQQQTWHKMTERLRKNWLPPDVAP